MMIKQFVVTTMAVASMATLLPGCGGGEGGGGPSVTLEEFAFPAAGAAITPGMTGLSIQHRSSGDASHRVSAYVVPVGTSVTADASRFYGRNCVGPVAACTGVVTATCTFNESRRLSCSPGNTVILPAGNYTVIAKACVYDASMNEVCDSKESALTVR